MFFNSYTEHERAARSTPALKNPRKFSPVTHISLCLTKMESLPSFYLRLFSTFQLLSTLTPSTFSHFLSSVILSSVISYLQSYPTFNHSTFSYTTYIQSFNLQSFYLRSFYLRSFDVQSRFPVHAHAAQTHAAHAQVMHAQDMHLRTSVRRHRAQYYLFREFPRSL